MGKRTKAVTGKVHKARPRDYWSTIDARAIPPLLPHLPPGRYAEPMAGNGALVRMLAPHAECAWAADLEPQGEGIVQGDALAAEIGDADYFCSNPPWTRGLLHKLIVHLSDRAPTFLLFDADWAFTQQAGPFMERCRKIINVGRLIWVPNTTNAGFMNCAWHEFGRPLAGAAPLFFGHGCKPSEADRRTRRVCPDCSVMIDRFAKWRLKERNGVPAPCHVDCSNPSGVTAEEPMPIMDWITRAAG